MALQKGIYICPHFAMSFLRSRLLDGVCMQNAFYEVTLPSTPVRSRMMYVGVQEMNLLQTQGEHQPTSQRGLR